MVNREQIEGGHSEACWLVDSHNLRTVVSSEMNSFIKSKPEEV